MCRGKLKQLAGGDQRKNISETEMGRYANKYIRGRESSLTLRGSTYKFHFLLLLPFFPIHRKKQIGCAAPSHSPPLLQLRSRLQIHRGRFCLLPPSFLPLLNRQNFPSSVQNSAIRHNSIKSQLISASLLSSFLSQTGTSFLSPFILTYVRCEEKNHHRVTQKTFFFPN